MKSILVYGIVVIFMAHAVMAGEKKVSRTVVVSENAGTPQRVVSENGKTKVFASASASATTNATAKASSSSSSDGAKNSVKTKAVNNQHTTRK